MRIFAVRSAGFFHPIHPSNNEAAMIKRISSVRSAKGMAALAASVALAAVAPAQAQAQGQSRSQAQATAPAAPQMRSRLLTSLTGYEVTEYLKRNDVIFVPVGPTEVNGGSPTDVEYVIPLAYALEMAEEGDGLVLPYLAYFYPGGTTSSPATVYMSTSDTLPFLKALTRSLIRQGFRRIVFLTSHGPSGNTMLPLVRETFDEHHVPVLWMGTDLVRAPTPPGQQAPGFGGGGPANGRQLVTFGSYELVGRLNDIPIGLSEPERKFERDPSNLSRFVPPTAGTPAGNFIADASEHGGYVRPITAEQRAQWGREGAAYIKSQVADFDVNGMLNALRLRDEFTKKLEKKYGDLLPAAGR
ncbi:creatininase family protein [Tsuneonella sp. HG222]